jgi:putative transcriptional regulator
MNDESTMKTKPEPMTHDWSRFDAMTDEEHHAAALADPDAQPLTEERLLHMKRTPQVKVMRRAFGLSQEEFSQRFRIPLGTLEAWEQALAEPDEVARAYLHVIARDSAAVIEALKPRVDPEG